MGQLGHFQKAHETTTAVKRRLSSVQLDLPSPEVVTTVKRLLFHLATIKRQELLS